MKVRPIFAWYDLWVGAFVDRPRRRVYVFPVPMLGLVFELRAASGRAPMAERRATRRTLRDEIDAELAQLGDGVAQDYCDHCGGGDPDDVHIVGNCPVCSSSEGPP